MSKHSGLGLGAREAVDAIDNPADLAKALQGEPILRGIELVLDARHVDVGRQMAVQRVRQRGVCRGAGGAHDAIGSHDDPRDRSSNSSNVSSSHLPHWTRNTPRAPRSNVPTTLPNFIIADCADTCTPRPTTASSSALISASPPVTSHLYSPRNTTPAGSSSGAVPNRGRKSRPTIAMITR